MSERTLKENLARFMDPAAFKESVPDPMKHIAPTMGKVKHDKLKLRRDIALKRADAAIRFFLKLDNRILLDRRAAMLNSPETKLNMCRHGADKGTYCGYCGGYSQGRVEE